MKVLLWETRHRIYRWKEEFLFWLIWKLPRRAVEIAVVRAWANATTGPFSSETPCRVSCDEVLRRWMRSEGGDPHPSTVSY